MKKVFLSMLAFVALIIPILVLDGKGTSGYLEPFTADYRITDLDNDDNVLPHEIKNENLKNIYNDDKGYHATFSRGHRLDCSSKSATSDPESQFCCTLTSPNGSTKNIEGESACSLFSKLVNLHKKN